jgi:XTP/dITP diphosphohydrolase
VKAVLASANPGKLRELAALLAPLGIELVSLIELGIDGAEETGLTFAENAILKARHASAATGLPAIADDSGLSVDVLNGAPGVRSARYAGCHATDRDNNAKLIEALAGATDTSAHYDCVIVYLASPEHPAPLIATGRWHGRIVREPRGIGGFGYDPHFYLEAQGVTAAELPAELKNRLSHRAQAVRRLLEMLAPGS